MLQRMTLKQNYQRHSMLGSKYTQFANKRVASSAVRSMSGLDRSTSRAAALPSMAEGRFQKSPITAPQSKLSDNSCKRPPTMGNTAGKGNFSEIDDIKSADYTLKDFNQPSPNFGQRRFSSQKQENNIVIQQQDEIRQLNT